MSERPLAKTRRALRNGLWCAHGFPIFKARVLPTILLVVVSFNGTALLAHQSAAQSAKQLLDQATYYHSIDDTTERAADLYRLVQTRYPHTLEAELATYYLGLYYQKKFYVLMNTSRVANWTAFNQAEAALQTYIKIYSNSGRKGYLADAYHTLAIIALQRGNRQAAESYLREMVSAASKDGTVYVSNIVWSPDKKALVNRTCDTRSLAAQTLKLSNLYFDQAIGELRSWAESACTR